MIILSNSNYETYRKYLKDAEPTLPKCLKCGKKLSDYNKVTTNKQSGTQCGE